MRKFLAPLLICVAPALAHADDETTSALIAAEGLARAAATLEAEAPAPERDLALAAVRFLRGIEAAWQARYRIGATDPLLPLPVLDSELPGNPAAQPMPASFVNDLAGDLAIAMAETRATLPGDAGDAGLVLLLDDLWFDLNANGLRDYDEGLLDLAGLPVPDAGPPVVRFDAADAHWLRAYTHLIEGMATLILAFDPEPAVARRMALGDTLARQFAEPPGQMARAPNMDEEARRWGPMLDRIAVVVQTLRNQPDPAKVAEAAGHLQAMIAANRDFWQAVAAETDNDREWIPNDDQQAALGFSLPPGAGNAWLAVLADAEQIIDGRLLIPFWRFAPGHGIDLKSWIDDPQPVEVLDWLQGSAALPHARPGLTVGDANFNRFTDMFGGRAGLYMVLFN